MGNGPEDKKSGKVNYVWVLAGGYLVYIAAQMLFGLPKSETPMVGLIGGIVFLIVGGLLMLREWKAYKYGLDHIDDPETWSDEAELEEPALQEGETPDQNDEEQALTDRLMARQPSSLLLGSQALTAAIMSHPPKLRMLQPDAYSLQQISDMRDQFGISVDELVTSCDTLIRTTAATGYYNIQNLIVTGDIPVSAKRWIREKFRSGVRLI